MTKIVKISANGEVFRDPKSPAPVGLDGPHRLYLNAGAGDLCSFGLLQQSSSLRENRSFDGAELLLVREGELRIIVAGGPTIKLGPGNCAVIPAGLHCQIDHSSLVCGIFMHSPANASGPADGAVDLVQFDWRQNLTSTKFSKVELLLGPIPRTSNHTWYSNDAAGFSAGVWAADAYSRKITTFLYTEFMHLLEGSVLLTDEDGTKFHITKGETVLVPSGTKCLWHSDEEITKVWCVQEAKSFKEIR
ncbi:cupin domain-containing protein [Mesorhizobium sp.]|uniref:cupin domain-containing protein n=1 Tax=Mesorhizobium sp. TaxID=1871066 RepID=UPI000FE5AACF|nr:MAG: DUF861 domain-containing protein [Mesorhizobium sp.]